MSDTNALFRILADLTDEMNGAAWAAHQPGQAVSGNEGPVLVAEDKNDLYRHLEVREAGDAASGVMVQPVMPCVDNVGNLQYLKLNAAGELVISQEGGNPKFKSDKSTCAALNVEQDVAVMSLTASKVHKMKQFAGACFQESVFRCVWNNNGSETELGRLAVGPGDYSEEENLEGIEFTSGTGTQEVKVVATQISGKKSDLHGLVIAREM